MAEYRLDGRLHPRHLRRLGLLLHDLEPAVKYRFRPKHLLLLGWPMLGHAIWHWQKKGLHPDDSRKGRES